MEKEESSSVRSNIQSYELPRLIESSFYSGATTERSDNALRAVFSKSKLPSSRRANRRVRNTLQPSLACPTRLRLTLLFGEIRQELSEALPETGWGTVKPPPDDFDDGYAACSLCVL